MNDDMMEYMVKQKMTMKGNMIRAACIAVVPVCLLWFFMGYPWVLFLILADFFLAKFVLFPRTSIEYEYLYCDKTISVDVIYGQEKRKTLADYSLDRMEILAPVGSHHLDAYKHRNLSTKDYWSLEESQEHKPYALIYDGKEKIILDLNPEFVKMVQNNAPRKVFTD